MKKIFLAFTLLCCFAISGCGQNQNLKKEIIGTWEDSPGTYDFYLRKTFTEDGRINTTIISIKPAKKEETIGESYEWLKNGMIWIKPDPLPNFKAQFPAEGFIIEINGDEMILKKKQSDEAGPGNTYHRVKDSGSTSATTD